MHHPMSHGMNIGGPTHFRQPRLVGSDPANDEIKGRRNVSKGRRQRLVRTIALPQRDDGFPTDSFDLSPQEPDILVSLDPIEVGRDQLKLETGTSRVQNENVHQS
jgi:hypothetical protein